MNNKLQEFTFEFANTKNYAVKWEAESPKNAMIYVHGAFSNGLEAKTLAEYAITQNTSLYSFDLPGWGHINISKLPSGHINNIDEYLNWIQGFTDYVIDTTGFTSPVLVGHSMGGLLAFLTSLQYPRYSATILSSPWFGTVAEIPWILQKLAHLMNKLWPTFRSKATFKVEELTHDPQIIQEHYQEIKEGIRIMKATARWLLSIQEGQQRAFALAQNMTHPVLFLVAEQDRLVDTNKIQQIHDLTSSATKNLLTYPNGFHELFNETFRENVFHDVFQWLQKHGYL